MSRCQRCDACESMWHSNNCKYCNYPEEDTRTAQQILIDNVLILQQGMDIAESNNNKDLQHVTDNNVGEIGGWLPIKSAPINQLVLIHYKNDYGKSRIIKARFIPRFTVTQDDLYSDCDDFYEYQEKDDVYYVREGWYEEIDNWDELNTIAVNQGEPTHWQHLPKPPATEMQHA